MNVLIFDPERKVKNIFSDLRLQLLPFYTLSYIDPDSLLKDLWFLSTKVIIFCGYDFFQSHHLKNRTVNNIFKYLKNGGCFLGIGPESCLLFCNNDKTYNDPEDIDNSYELPRVIKYKFNENQNKKKNIKTFFELKDDFCPLFGRKCLFPNDVKYVFSNSLIKKNINILATFENQNNDNCCVKTAIIHLKLQKGNAIFSTISIDDLSDEYVDECYKQLNSNEKKFNTKLNGINFIVGCLIKMGLKIKKKKDHENKSDIIYIYGLDSYELKNIFVNLSSKLSSEYSSNKKINLYKQNEFNESLTQISKLENCTDCYNLVFINDLSKQQKKKQCYFDIKKYFFQFKQDCPECKEAFGRTIGVTDTISSTNNFLSEYLTIFSVLPHGFFLTAETQTEGRGRGKNMWISPSGSLSTSVLIKLNLLNTKTLFLISFQYFASVIVLKLILSYGCKYFEELCGYEDLPIRIKWPNDIIVLSHDFFNTLEYKDVEKKFSFPDPILIQKVSGSLIETKISNEHYMLIWGFGINVSNKNPSVSLNQLVIKLNDLRSLKGLKPLKLIENEILMSKIMQALHFYYNDFLKFGFDSISSYYYKKWIHSNEKITCQNKEMQIKGINSNTGFLLAKDILTNRIVELNPDNNSFDLFNGLIFRKN